MFKKEVAKWQKFFGLHDWEINIHHETAKGARADVVWGLSDRQASIRLSIYWDGLEVTDYLIKKSAFHEVCHLLLAPLAYFGVQYFSNSEVDEKDHQIVRILENVIFDKGDKK